MTLPVDLESDNFRFYKTLHEDVLLKPDENNKWDVQFSNGDWINVSGQDSLRNAICIAIMTRYKELEEMSLYNDFGCRIHELIKEKTSNMHRYKMELFIEETLRKMRRVHKVNEIIVEEKMGNDYFIHRISFSVTSISDELVEGSVEI